jgi:predicted nucleotidyltransferase
VSAPDPIDAADALARQGAVFAFVHGSRARGTQSQDSDLDVAAYFHDPAPASFELDLPPGADLLVLNDAPLEIAGRIALEGVLLLDRDPALRAEWVARTRKIYADEKYRLDRSHREFLEAVGGG